jgi:hypothetical protein
MEIRPCSTQTVNINPEDMTSSLPNPLFGIIIICKKTSVSKPSFHACSEAKPEDQEKKDHRPKEMLFFLLLQGSSSEGHVSEPPKGLFVCKRYIKTLI